MELKDYEKILNTMPGTGVYVVREEDRGLLYFNKRVREISPEACLGTPCYEVWTGSCSCCPLKNIDGRQEAHSVSYNDPYGGIVDITAARTLWEETIPAFVITVTPRTDTEGYTYRKILHIDLERDHCDVLKSDPEGWQIGEGSLAGQLEQFARSGAIHPEDVERFVAFTRLEHLRGALSGDQLVLTLIYRRMAGEDCRWNLMEVLADQTDAGKTAILCIKDIHSVLQEGLERMWQKQTRTERDIQMAAILKSRFKMLNTVDLNSGLCQRMDLTQPADMERTFVGDYATYIKNAMNNYVHPDDVDNFWAVLSLDHLREKAAAVEDYSEEVCCYRQRGEPVRWIELRVIYSRQKDHVMVNILGQDITREKQQEESRRQVLEDRASIISSLSSLFFCTYYVDLEQDTFRAVTQQRRVGDVLGSEVNFTAALQIYASHFIHPEDRAEYLKVMDIRQLREQLRWWQPYVAVEYRRLPENPEADPDAWEWVRATAVLSRTGEDDLPKTAVYIAQEIAGSRRRSGADAGKK